MHPERDELYCAVIDGGDINAACLHDLSGIGNAFGGVIINSHSDGCTAVSVLKEEDNTIAASSRLKLIMVLKYDDGRSFTYECDEEELSQTGVQQL